MSVEGEGIESRKGKLRMKCMPTGKVRIDIGKIVTPQMA